MNEEFIYINGRQLRYVDESHIATIIGQPTIIDSSVFSRIAKIVNKDMPKKKTIETLIESSCIEIGNDSPAKYYCKFLKEDLLALKDERVIGRINFDVSIYKHIYRGNSLPTNIEHNLGLYAYKMDEDQIKKEYQGTTFKAIAEYLNNVFEIGGQYVFGDYTIFSNNKGLERHFLKMVSTDDKKDYYIINSIKMDFLYHSEFDSSSHDILK